MITQLLITSLMLMGAGLHAATYYVGPAGSDKKNGSQASPFRTIQKAADVMKPGDTCLILSGRYREAVVLKESGTEGKPLTFKAAPGQKVVIDGTDPVAGPWKVSAEGVYSTSWTGKTEQLFFKNQPMMWARFPNMKFDENWQADKKWALTEKGSQVGVAVHAGVGSIGQSLKGALFFIKLGKGNNCFSRTITRHEAGSAEIHWDSKEFLDNPRFTAEDGQSEKIKVAGLNGNRFFIKGSLALLDAEHEWFYAAQSNKLSLMPPGKMAPSAGEVTVKTRVYGFQAEDTAYLRLEGVDFFACSARFDKVRHVTMERCRFFYPYELHQFHDNPQVVEDQHPVFLLGEDNLIKSCLVQYSPGTSLYVIGRKNRIENSIVCEGSRHGRHNDPNITVRYDHRKGYGRDFSYQGRGGNVVSHCTVFNGSGIGVYLLGRGPSTAEYNHVFNVGQYCTDVSALYIPLGKDRRWTGFHHNWIHDINGIGIRCDQDGEQVLFHHNVVWNCKAGGKANGYSCRIYNNTIFVNNPNHPFLTVLQGQDELMTDWPVQNNAAFRLADRRDLREMKQLSKEEKKKRPFILDLKETKYIHHNKIITAKNHESLFVSTDEDNMDLRPRKGSALIDRGAKVQGVTDGFHGKAPDIGAYEYGGPYWTAGASWWPDGKKPPMTMAEATQRAHQMSHGKRFYKESHKRYRNQ